MTRSVRAALLSLIVIALPCAARADDPLALSREAARALAEKGLDLVAEGRYEAAADHFRQAEARFHAPTHLLFMAQAYEKLGKLMQARDACQKVIDEKLPNYAPDTFRDAQAQAQLLRDQLKTRIPTVTIVVQGARGVRVAIDGTAVDASSPIALDPGAHTIVATLDGAPSQSRSLSLREGASERVELRFAGETAVEPPRAEARSEARPDTRSDKGSLAPAAIAFAIGGAGIVAGTATGLASLAQVTELEELCPLKVGCSAEAEKHASSARAFGTASTIAFIAGGAALAAGVVLVSIRPGGAKPSQAPASASFQVRGGVSGLTFAGRF